MMSEENIIMQKPKVDEREYSFLTLSNGVKVITVSHKESEVSAASLIVDSGNFQNPDNVQGLAHFVEHMLFMGTEKYPEEKDFNEFTSKNGGHRNGYTTNDHTGYFFEIESSHFEACLDRFSRFFACPLLKKDGVQRELNAVHSEFEKGKTSDYWRKWHIVKTLCFGSNHPFNRFTTGNRSTLDIPDIHEYVKNYFYKNYSSNLMYLVIYGTESTEILEHYAKKYFSDIKNHNTPQRLYEGSIFFPPTMKEKIHHIIPVKDFRSLGLYFTIPSTFKDYQVSQVGILSHLIGNETVGSLYYHLKKKGWVTYLGVGGQFKWNGLMVFGCSFSMSVEGEKHIDEIILSFFEFIAFLRSLTTEMIKRIFEELKFIQDEVQFPFRDNHRPARVCKTLSRAIRIYHPKDVLKRGNYYEFDETRFHEELNHFRIDQMICIWNSSSHKKIIEMEDGESLFNTEPIYGGRYRSSDLSKDLIDKVTQTINKKDYQLPNHFSIPIPNPFIPKDLSILNFSSEEEKRRNQFPSKIYESELINVYFKQDTLFNRPKSAIYLRIFSPSPSKNAKNCICQKIFASLVNDALNEITYFAELVALGFKILGDKNGIFIRCNGWNDSLPKLLKMILEYITDFDGKFDETRFTVIKDVVIRRLKNMRVSTAVSSGIYLYRFCLSSLSSSFHFEELIEEGEKLSLNDLIEYYHECILDGKIKMEFLAVGNNTLKGILKLVKENLEDNPMINKKKISKEIEEEEEYFFQPKFVKLKPVEEKGVYVITCPTPNPLDNNSAAIYTLQIGERSPKIDIISYLLLLVMKSDVFDELRTKQQLGYSVGFRIRNVGYALKYAQFYVQSCDVSPLEIISRIEKLIVEYKSTLETKLKKENYFDELIDVMIKKYEEKPKRLLEECTGYWNENICRTYKFNRRIEYAKKLRDGDIKINDVMEFYDKYFFSDISRAVFQVLMFSKNHPIEKKVGIKMWSDNIRFLKNLGEDDIDGYFPTYTKY